MNLRHSTKGSGLRDMCEEGCQRVASGGILFASILLIVNSLE